MPPEGIDEARTAFQAEIAPGATRSRDAGGRFAATKPQPEPMFEPRPVEGDPLTGDTRDAGEDQRLRTREREVADGRIDERAERASAQDRQDAVRHAARAAGDDESAQGEPERLGEQGADDQDLEGGDGQGAAEADAEGAAEQDAQKYEVTVDGQTQEVSLEEALKGYIREQTFHQRMNKVAEARQAVEQEAANTLQTRDAYVQRLQYLQNVIATLTPHEPDWDKEYAANPQAARQAQKAHEHIHGVMNWVAQQMQQEAQQRAQEHDQRSARYAVEQFSSFVQEANIPDEKALQSEMSSMRAYAKLRGFAEGEIATVYDKRMLMVLRDAAKYHQAMAARPKPVIPGKGKTLTPGVATPVGNATRRSLDEAQQRLAKTGRLDDATSVFQRLLR